MLPATETESCSCFMFLVPAEREALVMGHQRSLIAGLVAASASVADLVGGNFGIGVVTSAFAVTVTAFGPGTAAQAPHFVSRSSDQ